MKRTLAAMQIHYDKIVNNDYDGVFLITGDEGKGKSNLELHLIEDWYNKRNGVCVEEDVKHVCLSMQQFSEDLKDCKKFEATAYDEAGDISNKRTMSKINVALSQAYQVIRGDNLCTFLVLPSIFDLDGFFTKRRARGLFHVTKRGRLQYYSQRRLRKIIALNQNRTIKSLNVVRPTFVDTFPKYKGVMLEAYLKKKAEKMQNVREDLYKQLNGEDEKSERNKIIIQMRNNGLTQTEIGNHVGLNRTTISKILKEELQGVTSD